MTSTTFHQGLPAPTRQCTEHDLDRRIAERLRAFKVSARVGGRRVEHTVLARTSSAAAAIAFESLGLPCACVRPAP